MWWSFRKSFTWGPFRATLGRKSGSVSVGVGPFRETFSSTGRRTGTLRIGGVRVIRSGGRRRR